VSLTTAGQVPGRIALVSGPDYTDCVTAAGVPLSAAIDTDALLAICRVRADGSIESSRVGGSQLRVDAAAVRAFVADRVDPTMVRR
jgi:hypothetical protein